MRFPLRIRLSFFNINISISLGDVIGVILTLVYGWPNIRGLGDYFQSFLSADEQAKKLVLSVKLLVETLVNLFVTKFLEALIEAYLA